MRAPSGGSRSCDVDGPGTPGGARTYARLEDPDLLAGAEETELVGRTLHLTPTEVDLPTGGTAKANLATLA